MKDATNFLRALIELNIGKGKNKSKEIQRSKWFLSWIKERYFTCYGTEMDITFSEGVVKIKSSIFTGVLPSECFG